MHKNSIYIVVFKWHKIIMHHDNFSYRGMLLWLMESDMMPMWRLFTLTKSLMCLTWQSHKDNCQSYIYSQKWHVWHDANVKTNVNCVWLWPNVTCLTWRHREGKHKINKSHLLDKHKCTKGNTYTMPPNPHNFNRLHPHLQWHEQIRSYIIAQFLAPHKF